MTPQNPITAGALLTIDLDAICDNWRALRGRIAGGDCAAVVKADAYGLGARRVGPALHAAGCRHFFVAHVDEGIALRSVLPDDATIFILHGPPPGAEPEVLAHGLVPVINSLQQLAAWRGLARQTGRALPAILQVDTGMAHLGLTNADLDALGADPEALTGIDLRLVMSHLVSAEAPEDPINSLQLQRFVAARRRLPSVPASLANSSGIFLGPNFHFDLGRPGAALYGVAPIAGAANPMRSVIRLQGKVIQTRHIDAGTAVGYGQHWTAARPTRVATVSVGYADGYLRSLSNRGQVHLDGQALPLVGRVSMDTITIDVTEVPEDRIHAGTLIDLAGPGNGVDAIAACAGTIGYEVLTSLGQRYARQYVGSGAQA